MDTRKLLAEKREDILRIAARHGAFNVRLFGSMARGEVRPDSDIDFLVEVGPRHRSFFPGGLAADLEVVRVSTPVGQRSGLLSDSVIVTDNLATVADVALDRVIGSLPMTDVDHALRHTLHV